MYRAHTVSVAITADPGRTYAYASDPSNLPTWTPGSALTGWAAAPHSISRT